MPRFRIVEVHPMSGWWGAAWVEDDPDGDAFAKVSRGICDAYSSALAVAGPQHTVSSLRIFIDTKARLVPAGSDARQTVVLSPSFTDRVSEGFEQAAVHVGAGFASLELDEQRRIVLDAVHAATRGMAQCRGLEMAAFEHARTAVLEAGSVFTWTSDWKSSPGRRWRARCSFRSTADGFGRLIVEVSTPDGSVSGTSSVQIAWTTMESYQRAAKTLRWTGADRLHVVPSIDFLGYDTGVFAVDVDQPSAGGLQLRWVQTPEVPSPPQRRSGAPAPQTENVARGDRRPSKAGEPLPAVALLLPDAATREIRAIGGGPTDYVPHEYWKTLHALFQQLNNTDWQDWWAAADLPTLEVSWFAAVEKERLLVRRSRNKVTARIERTGKSLRSTDHAQAARDDFAGLMTAVQRRMGLSTPPVLR
ncbi:hypothetical protein [Blastococcus brunescens]|uniref:Uncharacterized protein n=1 Tax=Blastococcus brunescens TaxID=1564165 RepID=A0ABZ1AXJ0_9ACTN|nr:hypothetical protein [Blastococcus sp. BMG 8361]WRL63281.1 hypothetical protein U6N30_26520 [Blastococcus sp. BMG 8361]